MIEIVIKVSDDGKISVGGPINDKVFCLGIIELAKKSIIDYTPSAIQVAKAIVPA